MDTITELASDERRARIVLACMIEPGDAVTGALVRKVGAVETVSLLDSAAGLPGMSDMEAGLWRKHLASRADVSMVRSVLEGTMPQCLEMMPDDEAWPVGFDALGDKAPLVLWARGDTGLLTASLPGLVAITGARAATAYGEQVASTLAGDLAAQGRLIVSSAAYGIDGTANRAALAADRPTIAVLAGGVDRPYPSGHRDLLDRIARDGVVLSESPPGTAPTRLRFIQRARIMAALSGATVIVEAGYRSGSLNVARQAAELGRPVGAVPGPVTSATSSGTHRLLRERTATVVTEAADVTAVLDPPVPHRSAPALERDDLRVAPTRAVPQRQTPGRSL